MDFQERMEAGKVAAANRRYKGLSTGKSAAGWDATPTYPEAQSWEGKRLLIRTNWRSDKSDALAIYVAAVFPERLWNELDGGPELTMEDVMQAIERRESADLLATF